MSKKQPLPKEYDGHILEEENFAGSFDEFEYGVWLSEVFYELYRTALEISNFCITLEI